MSVQMETELAGAVAHSGDADPADAARWAGSPLAADHWLEGPSGFPPGSVGASPPDDAMAVMAAARGVQLTRRQVTDVLAFTEFLAGRALLDEDRVDLEGDIVDAFEDSPRQATRFLRGLAGGVRRVASLSPTERSQRRLRALTTTYLTEHRRRADEVDPSPIMEMVNRYNPMVRHWASTGVVIVADAMAARVDQHRLVLHLVGRETEEPQALTQRLLDRTAHCGRLEIAELAASELRLLGTRALASRHGRRGAAPTAAGGGNGGRVSALDVDIVVQQVGYRAALVQAG